MRKQKKILLSILVLIVAIYSFLNREENLQNVKGVQVTPTPVASLSGTFVTKVIDGDTIDVSINGTKEKVRLIGIDTPEIVDPRKPVQCFGREASQKTKEVLLNQKVKLEADSTQDDRDRYRRLLRYVFLEDGTNINKYLIEQGYAYEYTYEEPYIYQSQFKEAQKIAQDSKRGLWGDICQ